MWVGEEFEREWIHVYVCVLSRSVMSDSLQSHGLYVDCQAPLSMGFSRREYQSGLPFPSPGDLPYSGTEPGSPALQADSLPIELPGKPIHNLRSFMAFSQSVLV